MKKEKPELWGKSLESIYQQALDANSVKNSFINLFEYVDYIFQDADLIKLTNIFDKQKSADCLDLERSRRGMLDFSEKIFKRLKILKTEDQDIKKLIQEVFDLKTGKIQVRNDPDGMFSILMTIEEVLWDLVRANNPKESLFKILNVTKFETLPNGRFALEWEGGAFYKRFSIEKVKVEKLQLTKGWYSWEHLQLFYAAYLEHEQRAQKEFCRKRTFEGLKWRHLGKEIDAILEGNSSKNIKFKWEDEYRLHLERVHRCLLDKINTYPDASIEESAKKSLPKNFIPFAFDNKTTKHACLNINGIIINFKKNTRKHLFLKKIISKRKLLFDEIINDLEGASKPTDFDPRARYYDICRGIQNSLANKGIRDFLVFDFNEVSINPIYKKSAS
jgi:hypothetical protein